jgi:hypothetical protein
MIRFTRITKSVQCPDGGSTDSDGGGGGKVSSFGANSFVSSGVLED